MQGYHVRAPCICSKLDCLQILCLTNSVRGYYCTRSLQVTCVYRLARMFSSIRSPEARAAWRMDLQANPTFTLLLRAIQSHLLQAQLLLM